MEDLIKQRSRERTKRFFLAENGVKDVKLENINGTEILCSHCNAKRFKLYTKFGGTTYGKYNRVMNSVPIKYNFTCKCGEMLILIENTFKYAKIKYGCGTDNCPKSKTQMDRDCLTCQFIYEK